MSLNRRGCRRISVNRAGPLRSQEDDNVVVHAVRVSDVPAVPDAFPYRFEIKRTRKVVVFSGDRHPTHSSADEEFLALARGAMCLCMRRS